jgi:hypothetical protein
VTIVLVMVIVSRVSVRQFVDFIYLAVTVPGFAGVIEHPLDPTHLIGLIRRFGFLQTGGLHTLD